jgi:tight adherence protein B
MSLLSIACGLAFGAGVLLIISGLQRSPIRRVTRFNLSGQNLPTDSVKRGAQALVCSVLVLALTGWPIAGLAAAVFGWFAAELLGGSRAVDAAVARTEAIATWTEMLRDTIGAAHGLESAIAATAPVAPGPVHDEIGALAARLQHTPLDTALGGLATDLDHPIGDLVVAALSAASRSSVRELGDLLGTLADAARDEASMQLRVEAARARVHTAVRVVASCTLLTALGLVVLNPTYVDVYGDAAGQAVLALVAGCWGLALWWLTSMSRFDRPQRFLAYGAEAQS